MAVAGALVATACGTEEPTAGRGAAISRDQARFGTTLWQARGHHLVALSLLEAAHREAALAHATHPLEEVLPSVEGQVRGRDGAAADGLRAALEGVVEAVRDGSAPEEVRAALDRALAALRTAEEAVVGELAAAPAYVGSVVAGLLAAAAHEYEEAAPEGRVSDLEEYQDAYGFFLAARELYARIGPGIEDAAAHEAEEIEEALGRLEAAFPGVEPPARPAPAADVERLASVVGHELQETVGAVVAAAVEPEEVWEAIDALLDQVVAEYREGEPEEAAELAARAYLENYELVEGQVIEHAPELNDRLEPLLSAELRAKIREGVPPEELEALVRQAKDLLARARQAVEEAGS
ncbi:MAG TPA: hypothetical protein VNO34_04650 [Actinomycetota bacterium]|nr:hypothetical protein [Actinomycetota bacterium]